jgi:outer membrane protein OmpA-like peptidoglycan-associated protein
MNIISQNLKKMGAFAATTLVLAACATTPVVPEGAVTARQKLTQLQGNSELAELAPMEIQAAERAVVAAEHPEKDRVLTTHLVLIADRKVEIAKSWAQSRYYEEEREELKRESEQARLDSRTREVDRARRDALIANSNTAIARNNATAARSDAALAQSATAVARGQAASAERDANAARIETENLESQIAALNARDTDRGLVVTLGDVLFATGKSTIVGANDDNLAKLAGFLNRYPDRTVTIEGHTDNVGSGGANIRLSKDRADSVKSYLVNQGVASSRLTTSGKGEGSPVSDNDTNTGRQQNRRVEVIIANSLPVVTTN